MILLVCSLARAALPAPTLGSDAVTLVGPAFLEPVIELRPDAAAFLAASRNADAAKALAAWPDNQVRGHVVADKKFLEAWALTHSGQGAKAVPFVDVIARAEHVPDAYKDLVVGEVLLAGDRPVEAAAALARVPRDTAIWVRAQLAMAEARQDAGATEDARAIWTALVERADPSPGSDVALWALALKSGLSSPKAQPYLHRLWSQYPTSTVGTVPPDVATTATPDERVTRAQRLMDASRWSDAIEAAGAAPFAATANGCRLAYVKGRSLHKQNRLTEAKGVLAPVGESCRGIDDDAGAGALYLLGKSIERGKDWPAAARAYEKLATLYPTHSMADDGKALAGVAWQIAGDDAKATALWTAQVAAYPTGDLAGEALFRLAWSSYLAGDTEGAIRWADLLVAQVPIGASASDFQAATYWSARWKLYPDVNEPNALTKDVVKKRAALDALETFVRTQPGSYYALLAAQRLYALAPDRAAALVRPYAPSADTVTWSVRTEFLLDARARTGFALARLGLAPAATTELASFELGTLAPAEAVLVTTIRSRVDPLLGHDAFKKYLVTHPPSTLGPDEGAILRYAYPEMYWDLVQETAGDFTYDPRVFHGLVREESSFNPEIVSFAGARGLTQLMPATAREVARKMGRTVTNAELFDPETNLAIGSRYFDTLARQWNGNLFLAVASYNAGPGNVQKWLAQSGERPLDEFVERIPIRETRHYVKRVLGTFEMYRTLYDDGPVFPDWSKYLPRASPAEG
jgi:soluble lytic murein transglycosylase